MPCITRRIFPSTCKALGVDFLLCSGYKFYGPHVGVLYSRPGALDRLPTDRLSVQDPAAPYRIETGTLNHAAIDGLRAAVEYIASWGSGSTLRERIVDAMTGIAALRTRTGEVLPRRGARASRACASGDRISPAAPRAPTVSITLARTTARRSRSRARQAGHLRLGRRFLRGARSAGPWARAARRTAAHRHLDVQHAR